MLPIQTSDDHQFRDGDQAGGVLGTPVNAQWLNAVQAELLAIIAAGGLQPGVDTTQVRQAIAALISNALNGYPTTLAMNNALAGKQTNLLVNLNTRQIIGSLNDAITPGEYNFGDAATDRPFSYGLLKVWKEYDGQVWQIAYELGDHLSALSVMYRHRFGTSWSSWRKSWDSGNFDPATKLDKTNPSTAGIWSHAGRIDATGMVSSGHLRINVLEVFSGAESPNGLKIRTNIPAYSNEFITVFIEGYDYRQARTIDIKLCWYGYPTQSQFYNVTASSAGGTDPELRIGIEDGKVVIWLGPTASDFYCASFAISVLAPNSPEDYLIGWSSASEAYTGGIVVSYINRFGSAVFDGNVRASSSLFLGWDDTCNLADLRTNSLTPIGYRKLPGGDIEQWGRINIGSVSGSAYAVGSPKNIDITFPIAFPTECFNVQVTAHPSDDGVTANSGRGSGTLRTFSKTGATIGVEPHMDGYSANFYLHWKARGK